MTDDLKDAMRLLVECMDELRLHDEEYKHVTRPELRTRLREFFNKRGLSDPIAAANTLCENPLKGRREPTTEREQAYLLADKLLDQPNCDPDDDLRLLARQLLRHRERAEFGEEAWATAIVCEKTVGYRDSGADEPTPRGNCFTVAIDGKGETRVVNFGAENLRKLIAKGLTWPVRVMKFGECCVVHDPRIGARWYNDHYCELCCYKELLPLPQRHQQERDVAIGSRIEQPHCVCIDTGKKAQFE